MNEQVGNPWLRPTLVAGRRNRLVDRHLVIVHQPGWQAIEDWHEIADKIRRIDPRIEVFIVESDMPNSVSRRRASQQPTLVVSPGPMGRFRPIRGKVYHGRIIPKFEQLRRLAAAGVRVPMTAILHPELKLDPGTWGEFVILKPTDIGTSSTGKGFQLIRTERVRYRRPDEYPDDHPGRFGPMMVQQFIDTGDHVGQYRVLTCFGEPLYCKFQQRDLPRIPLTAEDAAIEAAPIAGSSFEGKSINTYIYNSEVVALARAAYRAIPEVPFQGGDYIQDTRTGRYYVLELNPGGNTWHFSSEHSRRQVLAGIAVPEPERRTHLDAFGTVAHVLAERTRAEAT